MNEKDAKVVKILADLGMLKTPKLSDEAEAEIAHAERLVSDPDYKHEQDVLSVFDTSTKESKE